MALFDAPFFREVLPERVSAQCQGKPDLVPVVQLQLGTGKTLDVCHILHLADDWFTAQYFRDVETCEDMDLAFIPYQLVTMVTVSLHHTSSRRLGFTIPNRFLPAPPTA